MFEGLLQPAHLLIILLIVIVLFGGNKLPELGRGLGQAIKGFKSAINEDDSKSDQAAKSLPDKKSS
jgi:sec-independent protein translocase protein TatA